VATSEPCDLSDHRLSLITAVVDGRLRLMKNARRDEAPASLSQSTYSFSPSLTSSGVPDRPNRGSQKKDKQNAQDIDYHCIDRAIGSRHQPGHCRSDAARHEGYAGPETTGKTEAEAEAKASGSASATFCSPTGRAQDGASTFTVAVAVAIAVSFSNADEIRRLLLNVSRGKV